LIDIFLNQKYFLHQKTCHQLKYWEEYWEDEITERSFHPFETSTLETEQHKFQWSLRKRERMRCIVYPLRLLISPFYLPNYKPSGFASLNNIYA
jgi:hypothetical protein